ncbi:adenomatous polyposis coli protein-like [Tetranychus urticae]|uniref:Adenomatous polyposis coli protein n=1 Tax=Tetranychus urticae TaxID=32264 RepID=T1KM89_TETUR|nr:adenomatous polyposis coli protein-like [Tetranychus urticae]XP_015788536.1 adenomatous polyposis coli protein-like [Tetranychus urticae]
MRSHGCIPLLIQLIHPIGEDTRYHDEDRVDCFADNLDSDRENNGDFDYDDNDGCNGFHFGSRSRNPGEENLKELEIRNKASIALRNIVKYSEDTKAGKKEIKVLQLLEEIRGFCDKFKRGKGDLSISMDHPSEATSHLMKISFDEEHRVAICLLGGLHAIAELIFFDTKYHGNTTSPQCITVRRYAFMALTNLTFGDGTNKSILCSNKLFIRSLIEQLYSPSEELRQVTASVLRNLSWKADDQGKDTLREMGAVRMLMRAALEARKESTLKSILTALWNLSAHSTTNKAEICAVEGALKFLVSTLNYQSPNNTMVIIENGGGILRNVSSYIARHEHLRTILREFDTLFILLEQLKSPSLTIVSNACATLWNLSARCLQDQLKLVELGAIPMLRNLVNSKHKMISMGSAAALKNLSSVKNFEGRSLNRLTYTCSRPTNKTTEFKSPCNLIELPSINSKKVKSEIIEEENEEILKKEETVTKSSDDNELITNPAQNISIISQNQSISFGDNCITSTDVTPLMFSRTSSLGSISGLEAKSNATSQSSVRSEFSKIASGPVSPTDLPDSPTQTESLTCLLNGYPDDKIQTNVQSFQPFDLKAVEKIHCFGTKSSEEHLKSNQEKISELISTQINESICTKVEKATQIINQVQEACNRGIAENNMDSMKGSNSNDILSQPIAHESISLYSLESSDINSIKPPSCIDEASLSLESSNFQSIKTTTLRANRSKSTHEVQNENSNTGHSTSVPTTPVKKASSNGNFSSKTFVVRKRVGNIPGGTSENDNCSNINTINASGIKNRSVSTNKMCNSASIHNIDKMNGNFQSSVLSGHNNSSTISSLNKKTPVQSKIASLWKRSHPEKENVTTQGYVPPKGDNSSNLVKSNKGTGTGKTIPTSSTTITSPSNSTANNSSPATVTLTRSSTYEKLPSSPSEAIKMQSNLPASRKETKEMPSRVPLTKNRIRPAQDQITATLKQSKIVRLEKRKASLVN